MKNNQLGFSFIELSITLAIIAILAAISYPSYLHHTIKAHRLEGKTALLNLAASMEHYYLLNNTYQNATLATLAIPLTTPHEYYQLHITSANTDSYFLEAKPINSQQNDNVCGSLTYDHLGNRGTSNSSNTQKCWE